MADGLDVSLDDLIKRNRRSQGDTGSSSGSRGQGLLGRGRGRGRALLSGPGPIRRSSARASFRDTPYSLHNAGLNIREPEMVEAARNEEGTKLYVSNLHHRVSNNDIKVLFSEVGEVKECAIHFDTSGRSKGTAEVVYNRRSEALEAIRRFENMCLDRMPMKIELVGVNIDEPAMHPTRDVSLGYQRGVSRRALSVPNISHGSTLGRGRGRGQWRGGNNDRREIVSETALDADLEKYHQDANRRSS